MIARVWSGVVATERLPAYVDYVDRTGVGEYRTTSGNRAAYIMTRALDDERSELIAFSLWDDVEAIRRFAGEDIEAMVLYPEDRDFLLETPTLVHYEVHPQPDAPVTVPA